MFYTICGEVYKVLLRDRKGAWVISYDHPLEPRYIDREMLDKADRACAPAGYVIRTDEELTEAQKKRLEIITPLLNREDCIRDRKIRSQMITDIAEQENTTERRIRNLFFRYLATGVLTQPKPRPARIRPEYDSAIRTHYLSSSRNSLKMVYDLMILSNYSNNGERLVEDMPTWSSFKHYYDRHWRHRRKETEIAREGLSAYQRDKRTAFGSAMSWRENIGSFQMDITQADVHLVSQYDRSKLIGRPYITLAVDTCTQMIAGVHVGLESGETAVLSCLKNVVADKVKFCAEYGIAIKANEWPCNSMLPMEIITDKGGEFFGKRLDEILIKFGVQKTSLTPFRPDKKGIVEKSFDMIQSGYRAVLRGRGAVEEDAAERWSKDYRKQAMLTLEDFTKIVIRCILYLNNGRMVKTGHLSDDVPMTPSTLWQWYMENGKQELLAVEPEEIELLFLPRAKAKFTKKGIHHNKLYYAPDDIRNIRIGDTLEIAYDPKNTNEVFIVDDSKNMIPCVLTESYRRYSGYDYSEVEAMREREQAIEQEYRQRELEYRLSMRREILDIVNKAEEKAEIIEKVTNIEKNRKDERRRIS